MQKITTAIARIWNSGCLGKIAIALVGLLVIGCCGAALGGRRIPQQTITAPTGVPAPTNSPIPTRSPSPVPPSPLPAPTDVPLPTIVIKGVAPVGSACPPDAPIKGNIVDRGARKGEKIYHIPGSSSYQQTKPERCFANVPEAESAGYRAPN
jgi:hypothetical protein